MLPPHAVLWRWNRALVFPEGVVRIQKRISLTSFLKFPFIHLIQYGLKAFVLWLRSEPESSLHWP
jgi:hypothetical protein